MHVWHSQVLLKQKIFSLKNQITLSICLLAGLTMVVALKTLTSLCICTHVSFSYSPGDCISSFNTLTWEMFLAYSLKLDFHFNQNPIYLSPINILAHVLLCPDRNTEFKKKWKSRKFWVVLHLPTPTPVSRHCCRLPSYHPFSFSTFH